MFEIGKKPKKKGPKKEKLWKEISLNSVVIAGVGGMWRRVYRGIWKETLSWGVESTIPCTDDVL